MHLCFADTTERTAEEDEPPPLEELLDGPHKPLELTTYMKTETEEFSDFFSEVEYQSESQAYLYGKEPVGEEYAEAKVELYKPWGEYVIPTYIRVLDLEEWELDVNPLGTWGWKEKQLN